MSDQPKHLDGNWRQYLTPELKAHFERVGEDSVQFDVSNHSYRENREKQLAALAWLAEKRDRRERRERWTIRVGLATFVVAVLTLAATIWLGLR